MKIFTLIFLTSLLTFSCANSKKVTETTEKQEEKVAEEVIPNAKKGILTQDWAKYKNTASYNIIAASLTKNILSITITYQGGCQKHEFDLIGSSFIMKSLPPKRGIKLYHHPIEDDCRELVQKTLNFDISEFRYGQQEIILNLEHFPESISYTYKE
ncbi:hypothetical protein DNU06_16630 [Putridiphycobacter roseus]|uniref:DUF306 domain-containing protein n=1 Tax=Putridiphycobacter roseus TaxID=2219161 RepID=A0A2W1NJC3_9FLAO|nr:hypothetical protein [Putridiphycobacter roseus]PZE15722.1 hypothetical protein DNU06_16630 [Putridiphycobacter roseus]